MADAALLLTQEKALVKSTENIAINVQHMPEIEAKVGDKSVTLDENAAPDEEKESSGKKKGKKGKKGGKKGKGKKKKTPKLSLAEKRQLKMEKKISAYKSNTAEFLSFVDTMNKWRAKNADELIRQCRKADTDNSGSLEYDIVKLILLDLDIPCDSTELEILCRLVDTGDDVDTCELPSGYIDYEDLSDTIVAVSNYPENIPELTSFKPLSDKTFYHHTQYPGYVKLNLFFYLFKDVHKCASHKSIDTTDDVTLQFVAGEIRRMCRLPNYHIVFYKKETANATESIESIVDSTERPLDYGSTLRDLGFEGCEQKHEAEEYSLYYDYEVENYRTSLLDESLILNEVRGQVLNIKP